MGFQPWQMAKQRWNPSSAKLLKSLFPVIVLGECRYGISHSHDRKHYEKWLTEYLPKFRILDVDERTTIPYAAVRTELKRAGTPIPSNDVWIAALCRQHSLPLLSRDRHFDAVPGLRRLEW